MLHLYSSLWLPWLLSYIVYLLGVLIFVVLLLSSFLSGSSDQIYFFVHSEHLYISLVRL